MAPDTSKMYISSEDKLALLETFELETRHRTRAIRIALQTTLDSFLFRQETEIMNIPRELRNLKMSDLNAKWGGDWGKTMNMLKSEALKVKSGEEKVVRTEDEVRDVIEEKRKRKRVLEPGEESGRNAGVAGEFGGRTPSRLLSQTINGGNIPSTLTSKAKRLFSGGKRPKTASSTLATMNTSINSPLRPAKRATRATSILPSSPAHFRSHHQPQLPSTPRGPAPPPSASFTPSAYKVPVPSTTSFQPALPKDFPSYTNITMSTVKPPRAPRETDMMMSVNGSPLIWASRESHAQGQSQSHSSTPLASLALARLGTSGANARGDQANTPGSVGTDDELPDVEEMEKALLAASTRGDPVAEVDIDRNGGSRSGNGQVTLLGLGQAPTDFGIGTSQANGRKIIPSKGKRISTIRIRQSSAHSQPSSSYLSHLTHPSQPPTTHSTHTHTHPTSSTTPTLPSDKVQLNGTIMRITTSNGHIVEYDASKEKDMSEVDRELEEQGMGEEERGEVRRETGRKMRELEAMIRSFKF